LRTPLAIFKNVISNAMAGVTGHLHPKLRDNLAMADNSLNRLAALISDFIDIADIDADQLILDPHPIPIQQVIRDAIRTMEPQARAKKIDLTAVMPQQEIITNGDRRRLKQTLLNLIGNGIRYIPEKGKVCVLLSENDDELRLVVEDNGPGIERNEIESVFSRFVQVQRQVGEGEHGTGLGLTIARTIVELHGGKMWLESTPGRGASFCFTLPKYKPAATDEQSADTLQTSLCR
ncbi:MAG: HAMP domain-containing sensor histidine kinase, partial [Sedimentisphaerales bacterium]|nr:HAMP domain-containing sensor histidine kinase [Sedimentisphaerales bacterium]